MNLAVHTPQLRTFLFLTVMLSLNSSGLAAMDPPPLFVDVTSASGIHFEHINGIRDEKTYLVETKGGGAGFFDLDNDGDQDLYVGNDATPNLLFMNNGNGSFEETGLLAGLSVNAEGREQASMGIDVGDAIRNPEGLGTRIRVYNQGGFQTREVKRAGSIYSASDPRVHVGLGRSTRVERIEVRWPDGLTQEYKDIPADQYYRIDRRARVFQKVTEPTEPQRRATRLEDGNGIGFSFASAILVE